ncbi:MAG: DJ-1/PfpI family protein [Acidimicrobiia bacterium]|nr:DJ-1/PfpI family protein [Acidimicrobiia bacterium]
MEIAILAYDHMTALDAVGPYEVLSRLPGAETVFAGVRRGPVRCDTGSLAIVVDAALEEVLSPDVLVVPGWSGSKQETLLAPGRIRDWICSVDDHTTWTASTGTGAIVLAAAGLLMGRHAATHWLVADWLSDLGALPTARRIVRDGKYLTAAGSAGLDMALTLAADVAGARSAEAIQLLLEHDPAPPFDAGSVDRAPAEVVASMRAVRDYIVLGGPAA